MLKNGTKSVWDEICQNFHVGRNLFGTKSVTPLKDGLYNCCDTLGKKVPEFFDNIVQNTRNPRLEQAKIV